MEVAAAMMPAAEMVPVTSATMTAAVMATTVMTAAATSAMAATMTAFRDREVRYRKRRCEDDGGNSNCDPCHGTPHRCTSHRRKPDGPGMNAD